MFFSFWGTDWRPWPFVPSPRPPTPPAQTFSFEEPLVFGPVPRPAGYVDPDTIDPIIFGPQPRPYDFVDPALEEPVILVLWDGLGLIWKLSWDLKGKSWGSYSEHLYSSKEVGRQRIITCYGHLSLGHDQAAVPSEAMEEREEEEVPLRRKRSVYRRARTEFHTPAFEQFHTPLSADVLSQAAVSESAGPSVVADKGKAPMPELNIPAEFLAEDAQARQRLEEEQASERLVQRLRAEDLAKEDLPNVSEERAKELDDLMMRMTETDWLNLMMQVGVNILPLARELVRSGSLMGKPLKQSEVNQMMRNLVKNSSGRAAHHRYHNDESYSRLCFKHQLVTRCPWIHSPPSVVNAASTHHADDPDSAGGGSFNPAGSATPMTGSAVPDTAGGTLGTNVTVSTVPTSAAMDSAGSHHELGISPFADSADSSSPSPVSTDHIPIDVLFEPTSGGINEFFLDSDEDEQIGMSRVAADPDSDDEVLAEILFRGQYISGAGVVVVDKLPDDEIVDPRVKVETISESASSPPRSRRKHRGVRSDDSLWDKPVEDFFSSESESDDDMENYIPPIPYGAFKDWEIVRCPLSTTYYHVYYQENRRQKSFFYLKQLLPHVYREDLLLLRRRMNRLTVPPHTVGMVLLWELLFRQPFSSGLIENPMECLASAPFQEESGLTMQTALTEVAARDVAASFDSAVHRVHAGSFDAAVASLVSAACVAAAAYFVPAALQSSCFEKIYLETWN
ncbi:hypothetical protein Tco_0102831 [Tanacetum coccineum]